MPISKCYLEVVISFILFLLMLIYFYDFIFHKSEIRTALLEVGIDLGLLKKTLLKTSNIVCIAIHLLDIFLPCLMLNVCYQG